MTVVLPPSLGPLRRVDETASTNSDLLADVGGSAGEVLVAAHQTAGRGRFDRSWEAPARSSLLFSIRLRPPLPTSAWAWLTPLAGLAVTEALDARVAMVAVKWPNDVLVGDAKIAGVLTEARGDAVVVGVGVNVTQTAQQLPVRDSTSLAIAGAGDTDADGLLSDVLAALARQYDALIDAGGDAAGSGLLETYRSRCATIGRVIVVESADGELHGKASAISGSGMLVIETGDGPREVSAGDVRHVR